jgi:hypothetical protein
MQRLFRARVCKLSFCRRDVTFERRQNVFQRIDFRLDPRQVGGDGSVAILQKIDFVFQVKYRRRHFVDVSLERVNDVSLDVDLSVVVDGSRFDEFHDVKHFVQTIFQFPNPI